MIKLNKKIAEYEPDDLIVDVCPPARVGGGTIKASAGALKRGTLLAKGADGTLDILGKDSAAKPYGVLTDDVTVGAEATPVTVYISGKFNRNKVIAAASYTITDADIDAFRAYGIEFTAAMKY